MTSNRSQGFYAALALALCGACSFDTDSLYGTGEDGPADAGGRDEPNEPPLPWLPRVPDPDRVGDCEACARASEECSALRDICAENEDCRKALTCEGTNGDDPNAIVECQSESFVRELACREDCDPDDVFCVPECREYEHRLAAYRECVFQAACVEECNRGRNFECEGDYSWSLASPTETQAIIELELLNWVRQDLPTKGYAGVRVDACNITPCIAPVLGETDSQGVTQFALSLRDGETAGNTLRLQSDDPLWGLSVRLHPLSLRRSARLSEKTLSNSLEVGALGSVTGERIDPRKSRVSVLVLDCTLIPVRGAAIALDPPSNGTTVVYGQSGFFSTAEAATDGTGIGWVIDVEPDAPAAVVARIDDVVRARSTTVQGKEGWRTAVFAVPVDSDRD